MRCCYPHEEDRAWWPKSLSQPHSGVPVPKRVIEQARRVLTVSGGDVQVEIRHPDQTFGAALEHHNLVLGRDSRGRPAYVERSRPMASGAPPPSYVPDGTWDNYRPTTRQEGGSSSSNPAQATGQLEPCARKITCPACGTEQIATTEGYCTFCKGYPWQCKTTTSQGRMCGHWNFHWHDKCHACWIHYWNEHDEEWRVKRRALG